MSDDFTLYKFFEYQSVASAKSGKLTPSDTDYVCTDIYMMLTLRNQPQPVGLGRDLTPRDLWHFFREGLSNGLSCGSIHFYQHLKWSNDDYDPLSYKFGGHVCD